MSPAVRCATAPDLWTPGPALDTTRLSLPPVVLFAWATAAADRGEGAVSVGLALRFGEPASIALLRAGIDPVSCLRGDGRGY